MSGTMEISQETLETIGGYVKGNLAGWILDDIHRLIDRNTKVFGVVLTVLLVFVGYGTFLG